MLVHRPVEAPHLALRTRHRASEPERQASTITSAEHPRAANMVAIPSVPASEEANAGVDATRLQQADDLRPDAVVTAIRIAAADDGDHARSDPPDATGPGCFHGDGKLGQLGKYRRRTAKYMQLSQASSTPSCETGSRVKPAILIFSSMPVAARISARIGARMSSDPARGSTSVFRPISRAIGFRRVVRRRP